MSGPKLSASHGLSHLILTTTKWNTIIIVELKKMKQYYKFWNKYLLHYNDGHTFILPNMNLLLSSGVYIQKHLSILFEI